MVKGFVFYKDSEIPFVIDEDFKMELFSDKPILDEYCKEYNFQYDYILEGKCTFSSGSTYTKIVLIIGKSIGTTCYPKCYLIYNLERNENDRLTMSFESGVLDSIFQYKYKVIDYARQHVDCSVGKKEIYAIPFVADGNDYLLRYSIGRTSDLGLLEDFRRYGESLIELKTSKIQEMYRLFLLMQRFSSFMVSSIPGYFKKIKIYSNQIPVGFFYTNYMKEDYGSEYDIIFHDFDVQRFVPKILNNLSIDLGNNISKSIPLGHLTTPKVPSVPQRFIEQISAFEYLFEKLEHRKAKDNQFPLKKEIELMINRYQDIQASLLYSAEEIAKTLKNVRVEIVHGYSYYYDFSDNHRLQYMLIVLDKLLQAMSLEQMGFTLDDIKDYQKMIPFF